MPAQTLRRARRSVRLHAIATRLFVSDRYARARRADLLSRLYANPLVNEAAIYGAAKALRDREAATEQKRRSLQQYAPGAVFRTRIEVVSGHAVLTRGC